MVGLHFIIKKVVDKIGFDIKPSYNIVPSHDILILTPKPTLFYWGLSPTWANKPMNLINARIETLREKPAFKKTKPCIVVSNGWYEWKNPIIQKKFLFLSMMIIRLYILLGYITR